MKKTGGTPGDFEDKNGNLNTTANDDLERALMAIVKAQQLDTAEENRLIKEANNMIEETVIDAKNLGSANRHPRISGAPMLTLTDAHRHLKQRFGSKIHNTPQVEEFVEKRPTMIMLNSMQKITLWKCERIEKMCEKVLYSGNNIRQIREFSDWEDAVIDRSFKLCVTTDEIIRCLHLEPELLDLKENLDKIWGNHTDQIEKFRIACIDFEKNVRNIVRAYPNSEAKIRNRVTKSMDDVMTNFSLMPGFSDTVGEYRVGISERILLLAKEISNFAHNLIEKLTGNFEES